jgi:hypothetical protein
MSQFVSFLSQAATEQGAQCPELCPGKQQLKHSPAMNIFEQMLTLAAIAVSGAGMRTVFSAMALRRRIK